MHSHYDVRFTEFMDAFVKEHAEVAVNQKPGWNIHWNPKQLDQEKTPCPGHENPTGRQPPCTPTRKIRAGRQL